MVERGTWFVFAGDIKQEGDTVSALEKSAIFLGRLYKDFTFIQLRCH